MNTSQLGILKYKIPLKQQSRPRKFTGRLLFKIWFYQYLTMQNYSIYKVVHTLT